MKEQSNEYDELLTKTRDLRLLLNYTNLKLAKTELALSEANRKLSLCRDTLTSFVDKVECDQAHSVDSYNKFKLTLEQQRITPQNRDND